MPSQTANSQERTNEKISILIKKAGSLPADYELTTINAYLTDDATDTTYLKVASGFSLNPSPIRSDKDTEGNSVILAVDVPANMQVLQQTPEECEALITAFNGVKCDIILLYADPDLAVNNNTVTSVVGDRIAIINNVTPYLYEVHADATDFKINIDISREIKSTDRISVFKTIIADVP